MLEKLKRRIPEAKDEALLQDMLDGGIVLLLSLLAVIGTAVSMPAMPKIPPPTVTARSTHMLGRLIDVETTRG